MTQENNHPASPVEAPQAVVKTKKSFSIVWLVPLVAILIGGSLIYKAVTEKGPEITISFKDAEGLEAGKTKIKYKDVEIGQVTAINFAKNLSHIVVSAELAKGATDYLTDKTRFWVVRARVSSGSVSGLGTLFGGAYIAMDPRKEGNLRDNFTGLEFPPVVSTNEPGRHFKLKAKKLGSLQQGTVVYYRQIQVGKVDSYALAENGQDVDINLFINKPYDQYVRKNTRFWDASGIDVTLGADGLKINTESVLTIMSGGLAFDNPKGFVEDQPPEDGQVFILYESFDAAQEIKYTLKEYWRLVFEGSARGLKAGAQVELKGMILGKVMDVSLQFGDDPSDVSIAVLIETYPERLAGETGFPNRVERNKWVDYLVSKGLRAQLKTSSMLTGQLYVDLNFYPDLPPAKVDWEGKYPLFPTIPKTSEEVLNAVEDFAAKLKSLPIQKIGSDLQAIVANLKKTTQQISTDEVESIIHNLNSFTGQLNASNLDALVESLNKTIQDIGVLVDDVNTGGDGEVAATLTQAQKTMISIEQILSSESSFNQETTRAMREIADAASAIRMLVDFLERQPNALIYGKGENE